MNSLSHIQATEALDVMAQWVEITMAQSGRKRTEVETLSTLRPAVLLLGKMTITHLEWESVEGLIAQLDASRKIVLSSVYKYCALIPGRIVVYLFTYKDPNGVALSGNYWEYDVTSSISGYFMLSVCSTHPKLDLLSFYTFPFYDWIYAFNYFSR